MKSKHLTARIKQCQALAECSPCPRRKFGAVLFDPVRNTDIGSGYNGAPRGGGDLCGGDRCFRDGLKPEEVVVADHMQHSDDQCGVDDDDAYLWVQGKKVSIQVEGADDSGPFSVTKYNSWRDDVEAARTKLLAENPPIPSGTNLQIGCHHAEMNVICNAAASTVSTAGAWLVVTGEPCLMCSKLLHHAGITKVICVKGGYLGGDEGPAYLRAHGVAVEYVEGPQDPRSMS